MIAINMEMPKCCISCQIGDNVPNCPCKGSTLIFDYQDKRHYDCPLVAIITCKNCKHKVFLASDNDGNITYMCDKHCKNITNEDFYCADAERRE